MTHRGIKIVSISRNQYLKLCTHENQEIRKLWCHFLPLVSYEHDDHIGIGMLSSIF